MGLGGEDEYFEIDLLMRRIGVDIVKKRRDLFNWNVKYFENDCLKEEVHHRN